MLNCGSAIGNATLTLRPDDPCCTSTLPDTGCSVPWTVSFRSEAEIARLLDVELRQRNRKRHADLAARRSLLHFHAAGHGLLRTVDRQLQIGSRDSAASRC